ncbi:MAG: UDP-2,3-diacylglucosamine diphosphatase [Paludibacteraceae bacterium]|nr:UDP-2,3-diacylglucosamine diphosphatase [Paludibacteraceae bacterium]
MQEKTYYATVVLSDIHVGNNHAKVNEVINFLESVKCDKLILNGDIIDGWQLQKSGARWRKRYTRFFRVVMKMMEKGDTKVIYVRGNHDDFLDHVLPIKILNFRVVKSYIHYSHGKKYFVLHGDIFDPITSRIPWLAMLGDVGYVFLLWINKRHNKKRQKKGLPYHSISQAIKKKVKRVVSYLSDFENEMIKFAKFKHVDGLICGHIHQPENKYIGTIHYLNSGDWVESLTALVEDAQGNWKIVYYDGEVSLSNED